MTPQQPNLDRIAQFLDQLKIALHPQEEMVQARAMRLSALFDAIAGFRRDKVPPRSAPERTFDAVHFSSFLADLRSGLTASRHDGRLMNVWAVAGLKRKEVPTASVLGWLLDCNGSHGFGAAVLEALMDVLFAKYPARGLQRVRLGRHYRLAVEHHSLGETSNRVDLAVDAENAVIFIEVKIDAPQRENQLNDYLQIARARASAQGKPIACLLYLSKSLPENAPEEVLHLRWSDIAHAIDKAVPISAEATVSGAIVRQFAAHVKRLH
jgi:hypothetical protein